MSTPAIDHCLKEMEETHQQLSVFLQALRTGRSQIAREETKTWLQGPVSDHQTWIAMLDQGIAILKTLAGTDYPHFPMPEMPEEVQVDVEELYANLTKSADNMRETMSLLRRQAAKRPEPVPADAHAPAQPSEKPSETSQPPEKLSETSQPSARPADPAAPEGRRGRRESAEG